MCVRERDREGVIVMKRPFSGCLTSHTNIKKNVATFQGFGYNALPTQLKVDFTEMGGYFRFIGNCLYSKNSNVVKYYYNLK